MPMTFTRAEQLYLALDHLDNAEEVITKTLKAAADDIADSAANDPDTRTQRRTVLAQLAFDLRMATGRAHAKPNTIVRPATDAEQRDAILMKAQLLVHEEGASHDCGEWRQGHLCAVCGRWIGLVR